MVQIPNAHRVGDMPAGGTVIPEGVYHVRLDKAVYKEAKKTKTPMAEVTFTIFGPEEAEEFHGRKLFDNLMLAGDGEFRTRQLLEASGENEDFILEDTEQLLLREVKVVVTTEKERIDPDTKQTYPERSKITRYMSLEEAV